MINWMQKHRKYLVVTIWISTIAFVGAGFVGWGAYSFASGGNVVAYVGNLEVTRDDLNRQYSNLYNFYNQRLFNGNLDAEQAKALGLEEQALSMLVSRTLMLNYAKDLGLRASESEIIEQVTNERAFWSNGAFDASVYERALQQVNLRPKDYEKDLGESIMLEKLSALLNLPLTDLEKNLLEAVAFSKDRVGIEIFSANIAAINPTQEEVKAYWESNKDAYLTDRAYKVVYIDVDPKSIPAKEEELQSHYESFKNEFLDINGQPLKYESAKDKVIEHYKQSQAEKEALREYIQLRKADSNSTIGEELVILENDRSFGNEFLDALLALKVGETFKPILTPKGYVSARLTEIIESTQKPFEEAQKQAREDLVNKLAFEGMEAEAKKALETFSGSKVKKEWDLGFISRAEVPKISGLNEGESADFVAQLFSRSEPKGIILLQNKAILYEILEQRLEKIDILTQDLEALFKNGAQLKNSLVEQDFLEYLGKHYKVVRN